jgi:CheY-like chemotaxis protein
MHVLIIEDEPLVALDLQCFLEELGADSVEIAETENQALFLAGERRPDLITADYGLREGTGPAAVRRIRDDLGEVPVVYVTGQPERCATEAGQSQIIAKPVLWLELAHAVSAHNLPPLQSEL